MVSRTWLPNLSTARVFMFVFKEERRVCLEEEGVEGEVKKCSTMGEQVASLHQSSKSGWEREAMELDTRILCG